MGSAEVMMVTIVQRRRELPTAPRSERHAFRRDIQGLRAMAVIAVVLYHSKFEWAAGGFLGVDVFFVISGYVITEMLWREYERNNRISLSDFFGRRARRLLPALTALLLFVGIASILLLNPIEDQRTAYRSSLATTAFSANLLYANDSMGYFDRPADANVLLHTWSLAVEEQFYLVYPCVFAGLLWFARRRRSPRITVFSGLSVLGLLSLVVKSQTPALQSFYLPHTRAWELLAGALVALLPLARLPSRLRSLAGVAGAALVSICIFGFEHVKTLPAAGSLVPVAGAVALVAAGTDVGAVTSRALSARPLVWIGDHSYAWYLWHWPLMVMARATFLSESSTLACAAGFAALVPAAWSTQLLEQRFRRDNTLVGRRAVGLTFRCIAISAAAAGVLFAGATALGRSDQVAAAIRAGAEYPATELGCNRGVAELPPQCTIGTGSVRVVMLGDSTAGHFSAPAIAAVDRAGVTLQLSSLPGCAPVPVDARPAADRSSETGCLAKLEASLVAIEELRPDRVVLTASPKHVLSNRDVFVDPSTNAIATTAAHKARIWSEALRIVLERLDRAGVQTTVIQAVPMLDVAPLECSTWRLLVNACDDSVPVDVSERVDALYREALREAASGLASARIVDLTGALCPTGICAAYDSEWVYRDEIHLSVSGSRRLTDAFVDVLRSKS